MRSGDALILAGVCAAAVWTVGFEQGRTRQIVREVVRVETKEVVRYVDSRPERGVTLVHPFTGATWTGYGATAAMFYPMLSVSMTPSTLYYSHGGIR